MHYRCLCSFPTTMAIKAYYSHCVKKFSKHKTNKYICMYACIYFKPMKFRQLNLLELEARHLIDVSFPETTNGFA